MVASVYRHVQDHALIKDNSQSISKIILILYHSYCENLTEREICVHVVAAFLGGSNRNIKGTYIEHL